MKGAIDGVNMAKLVYRGSRDGFNAQDFHSRCDGQGSTVTIVKSDKGKVFGGYTDIEWSMGGRKQGSGNSFVFSVSHGYLHKFYCLKKDEEVFHYPDGLPVFGAGHYLHLSPNKQGSCYTQSQSYEQPPFDNPNEFLAGSKNFTFEEIEIFTLN